jgi:hypothetical protein
MSGYKPIFIKGNATGLVQSRENFLLPNDAYPVLENAYVWRERILRKSGYQLLARLRRVFVDQSLGTASGGGGFSGNLITIFSLEASAEIEVGSVVVSDGTNTFTDNSLGILVGTPAGSGTINYVTGAITITGAIGGAPLTISFNYYPTLPVMGIRQRDLSPLNNEMTVIWDTKYAYNFTASGFVEFIPGTTWSSGLPQANSNFFWTTNYWVSSTNVKLFWATNDSGTSGDPIRYTNGVGSGTGAWIDFAPQIDASGNLLTQCLALLPFRGRLVAFNTLEGLTLAASTSYSNRIRWAAVGNPITTVSSIVTVVSANAWRDDIRGKGGYLDIPTNEDIVCVGFVRDNLVIYCENSTWQLRYTGRTIAPFQIEKVNTELGSASTFSAIQFDTSLVGLGDKGVVECDSFKSELIDIKIPDLVMTKINNSNFGQKRVHGIRNYLRRLAYWTYPEVENNGIFPDRRLVYNYENDSWAIFTDSLTTLGLFQPISYRTWANPTGGLPSEKLQWKEANFSWGNKPENVLSVIGGNQQGYIEFLDAQTTNDESLTITAITGYTTTATQITSANHNLQTGNVIKIDQIPAGTPFAASLNTRIFGIIVNTPNTFLLMIYNPMTQQFSTPQLDALATYIGGGQIYVRDNFSITSKKFNFLEQGQNIQIGYIDLLMNTTESGAMTLNVYIDYNDNSASNQLPNNIVPATGSTNPFFNTIIPTTTAGLDLTDSTKTNQRVFCPTRGNYLTLEYTLSNSQMVGIEQESDVQVDMQIIWMRQAGRVGNI